MRSSVIFSFIKISGFSLRNVIAGKTIKPRKLLVSNIVLSFSWKKKQQKNVHHEKKIMRENWKWEVL